MQKMQITQKAANSLADYKAGLAIHHQDNILLWNISIIDHTLPSTIRAVIGTLTCTIMLWPEIA